MTNEEILKKHLPIYGWHLPVIDAKEYIEAALEEARNQGRGGGPVWVKAQDELPEKEGEYYIKPKDGHFLSKIYYHPKNPYYSSRKFREYVFEWLKEPDKLEQSKKEQ